MVGVADRLRRPGGPGGARTAWPAPGGFADVGWLACETFRVASEVEYLRVGERHVSCPNRAISSSRGDRRLDTAPSARPAIAAVARDGSVLSEIGPGDHLDSLTLASLEEESVS